ncbi:hypothetical protein JW824_06105, partial [bacterium]|nr:hypothetical protein [bacterium]
NGPDVYSPGGEVLESSDYINMTEYPVYPAVRTEGTLDDIRIVPNPYHKKRDGMYLPEDPNKIMFINLPLECTIRIYTESLDLIKTIDHQGLHEDMWDFTTKEHQPYEFYDLAKSGLYIAHFETPEGETAIKKFVIVR